MEKKQALKQKFREFIEGLSKDDIVAVVHHTDPDGVCSGVIMAKLVEKARGKQIDLRLNQASSDIPITDETVEKLRQANANKVITADLCVDQAPKNIREIEKFAEILVIDHHKVYEDIGSERTVFIKPHFITDKNPAAYPASKLCFDLASEVADMKSLDWVAAIGLIGDCAFNSWKDFLDEVFSKYNVEKKQDIFETELGKAASLVSDAECYDNSKVEESFDVVYGASSPSDVLNSSLQKYRESVENEIEYWINHINEFAEFFDDISLIFYMIKAKYKIKAPTNTRLSLKHPDKTIILLQESKNGMISISGRRRDEKVAVNDLLEKSVKGLEGASAGGHVPAAGAKIKKEDLQKFKENLINILKNG